jgi:transcriptional regulator with XRE-family HTH domain
MDEIAIFWERVKQLIKKKKMTQEQVARAEQIWASCNSGSPKQE